MYIINSLYQYEEEEKKTRKKQKQQIKMKSHLMNFEMSSNFSAYKINK